VKYRITLAALLLALFVRASMADDKMDAKALEVVKRTAELYKNAKAMRAEGTFVNRPASKGEKPEIRIVAVYDVTRPNLLCLKTRVNGDPKKGPDVICDGKRLTVYRKALKKYIQEEAPDNLGEMGARLFRVGPATGMLFGNVLADDPADVLMQGVNSCSYVGLDKVNGAPAHHMKFSQDQFDWEMWVAAEGKPFVLQMVRIVDSDNGKVTTTETYKNWKLDSVPAKETFTFVPPPDATKVDESSEEQGK
jgi:hypothetical protein